MMHRAWAIYVGVLFTVTASLLGLVIAPDQQLRSLDRVLDEDDRVHPVAYFGDAARGRAVYIDLGCIYCHSQQVRPADFGADVDRGWGGRRSVARDYLFEAPPLLGTMRTGPDLSNIGVRQPSAEWHYLHLYDPQITSPGSIMPRFPFLFRRLTEIEARALGGDALRADVIALPDGYDSERPFIQPSSRGRALVTYLLRLDQSYEVPEGAMSTEPASRNVGRKIGDPEPPDAPDVIDIHEPIVREHTEPREGREPTPLWLLFLYLAITGVGGWYLGTYSGAFDRSIYDEDPAALARRASLDSAPPPIDPMRIGRRVYARCSACHQSDGQGVAGAYPPLAGSAWVTDPAPILAGILLKGIRGPLEVNGVVYNQQMPHWRMLSDDDLAAVMTYIRGSWGNEASAVDAALVAATRRYFADDRAEWNEADLIAFRDGVLDGRIVISAADSPGSAAP